MAWEFPVESSQPQTPASDPQGKDQRIISLVPSASYLGEVSVVHVGEETAPMSHAEY